MRGGLGRSPWRSCRGRESGCAGASQPWCRGPFDGDPPVLPRRVHAETVRRAAGGGRPTAPPASSCAATRSSRSSRPSAATSWMPTGRPARRGPIGRLIAGCPVTLNGAAKHQMRSNRGRIASGSAGGGNELVEHGGRLARGRRQQQVEVVRPPCRHLGGVRALPGLAGGVAGVGQARADARERPRVRLDIGRRQRPADRGGERRPACAGTPSRPTAGGASRTPRRTARGGPPGSTWWPERLEQARGLRHRRRRSRRRRSRPLPRPTRT